MSHRKFEHPRIGSLGFLPKKRSNRIFPSSKTYKEIIHIYYPYISQFASLKVASTHVLRICNIVSSKSYQNPIIDEVTLMECPPIEVVGLCAYALSSGHLVKLKTIKLQRGLNLDQSKDISFDSQFFTNFTYSLQFIIKHSVIFRFLCCTFIKTNSMIKKKYFFETDIIGGSPKMKLEFWLKLNNKKIYINSIFHENDIIDAIGITKGHGTKGVVSRWGITRLPRKTHRGLRKVACIGPWTPSRVAWTISRAGQKGYHKRTLFNKKIYKIGSEENFSYYSNSLSDSIVKSVNCMGGFKKFGFINNDYLIIKGSMTGSSKRPILLRKNIKNKISSVITEKIILKYVDTSSKRGHGRYESSADKFSKMNFRFK
ncbi:ribosomal protein L3 (nucleomorph) [Bigelowiella natans]|uniref:Ribosomal protein L3 n=1 Tax=Bigelowiella natans TaxID=227086 RepID=Q3LWC1_BIGNA|nr:ribosomal protein L3 [Bigelowiella natans]ABA27245.1 ribosomal protein L3 [Bigelowiella natans]|mmetsp:Transcript_4254/g.6585  ORF Transcript_4254/g.6585 Transcript_4254/m.6585 type:complete len:371 (+) Transcript_4254:3-1115(+)